MRIGVDIDNVISNFDECLLKEYLVHDKILRNTGIIDQTKWVRDGMFDWSKDEEVEFYKSNIERIAIDLDVIENAPEYIEKLMNEGNEIYIISGRDNGEYKNPYEMTEEWLKKHNIGYTKLILTDAYDSHAKSIECKNYNIDIMIDDSLRTCEDLKNSGINVLMMERKFCKQKNSNIEMVRNWQEIYKKITGRRVNVILDTDTYNECDDQFALAYMLKSQDIFNIEAITVAPYSHKKRNETVISGQEKSYSEILKICRYLDFDTTNKVFKGSKDYISNGYKENNDAVNKIIEIALKNDKTYILGIGAITNIALAIKKEPKIINRIEIIWLGGHSLLQDNNQEFNFRQDVDAVRIVFESKVKLTVIPCKNVASNLVTSIHELNYYLKDKNELCNYLIARFHNDGYHGVQERRVIWDISAIAYLINKEWFTSKDISCPNIKDDTSYELTTNNHKITMINWINVNGVYKDLFKKLGENND